MNHLDVVRHIRSIDFAITSSLIKQISLVMINNREETF